VTLTLPAGAYAVTAKVEVVNRATNQGASSLCRLTLVGGTDIDESIAHYLSAYPQNGSHAMLPLQGAFTSAATTTVTLRCFIDNQGIGVASDGSLMAIQIG